MKKLTKSQARANRRYRKSHREQLRVSGRISYTARNAKRRKENPIGWLLYHAKGRAKKNGIKFDITTNDVEKVTHCPVLKIQLDYCSSKDMNGQTVPNAASLDRIIPSLGYVKGNVIVVSFRANVLKRNATPEELKQLAEFYCNKKKPVE